MFRDPSSAIARIVAALLLAGAGFLFYRAAYLIGVGYAARYVVWLQVLTWIELGLAATIAASALVWLVGGSSVWSRRTLRLTAVIVVLHAVRVAVFALARIGPWIDFDARPEFRPVDPASWSWFGVWFASGMASVSLLVLVAALVWHWRVAGRTGAIHK